MSFQNVVSVEKVRGFGYEQLHEYYITYQNKIQMIENLKVTFACNFKLNTFPFENHSCDFSLHDKIHTEESLILKPPALVFHENQYINIHNDSLLFLNTPKISTSQLSSFPPLSCFSSVTYQGGIHILLKLSLMEQFRLVTSIYEAANIHSILDCRDKRMDNTPLWFMYVTATVQLLMVISLNYS